MKNWKFWIFAVFAVITAIVPLSIIWKYENTLRHGALYKFRTQPVDPYDAFRGRYVTLSFADNLTERQNSTTEEESDYRSRNKLLYVRLATGADGFAKPVEASRAPLAGDNVITVDDAYYTGDSWRLDYPFDRYYLPEDMAPLAEQLYTQANRRGNRGETPSGETYVAVRVRNGVGVIEELYINGKPVREAVRAELQKQKMQQEKEKTERATPL